MGPPGAGKSTLAKGFKNYKVYDLDDYRWNLPLEASNYDHVAIVNPFSSLQEMLCYLQAFPLHIKLLLYLDNTTLRNIPDIEEYKTNCLKTYEQAKPFFMFTHKLSRDFIPSDTAPHTFD